MARKTVRRPKSGGTQNGMIPQRYDYWRFGTGTPEHYPLDFYVEGAGEYHCKPNYVTGIFDRPNATHFYYHLQGNAEFEYGLNRTTVNPGDLLIIPHGHPYYYRGSQKLRFHWFGLNNHWPKVLGETPAIRVYQLGPDEKTESRFVEIRETLILGKPGYPLRAIGMFYELLARIFDLTSPVQLPHSDYPDTVRNAIIYLRENYTQAFSATKTAAWVGVSQSHLRALFEKWVGESPQQFHSRCRIEEAKRLLDEQRISITQTAHQVGYHDVRYFSRVFKQNTGMTPSQYIALGTNNSN